jgi:hypothetical protein
VARIVPLWVSRLLSRDKLSVIVALAQRSNAGATPFNPAGKSVYDIQKAVRTGQWAKDDAIDHAQSMASRVVLPDGTDPTYTQKKDERDEWKQLARDLQKTSVLVESRREDETNSSAMLYLLAMLSERVCRDASKVKDDICLPADDDDATQSKSKQMMASLQRPKSLEQMVRLLNMWILLCHATSVVPCLTLSAFVDEVAFHPMAEKQYDWPVAFEIIVQYLMHVEASAGELQIGNVRSKMGGIDAVRNAAEAKAKDVYDAAIFRSHGGNPGKSALGSQVAEKDISGNKKSSRGCACFNLGTKHGPNVLESPRKCKFRHACDKELDEKDEQGRWKHCLNSAGTPGHKRGECDHPNKRK